MSADAAFMFVTVQPAHTINLGWRTIYGPGATFLTSAERARSYAAEGFVAIDGPTLCTTPLGAP